MNYKELQQEIQKINKDMKKILLVLTNLQQLEKNQGDYTDKELKKMSYDFIIEIEENIVKINNILKNTNLQYIMKEKQLNKLKNHMGLCKSLYINGNMEHHKQELIKDLKLN